MASEKRDPPTSREASKHMNITDDLCKFAANTTYSSIPKAFIQTLKLFLLDYIGIAAYGAEHAESSPSFLRAIEIMNNNQQGHGSSTVITKGHHYQVQHAAILNAAFAHSLDFDDTFAAGSLHAGVTSITAALTEAGSATGQRFLTAMAIGYETTCRVGRALGSGSYARGFHNTSVAGIFGAVAAIGSLRGHDAETIARAFGIAGSKAAGSMQFFENGSWNKRLHPGFAVHDALMALAFAEAGVLASVYPIEGRNGLLLAYSGTSTVEGLVEGLGKEWISDDSAIKPYPGCRASHATIDLALQMRAENDVRGGVKEIKLSMGPSAFQLVGRPDDNKIHPKNVVEGQFSAYFQMAANWLNGPSGWAIFDHLNDDAVSNLSDRISIDVDDNLTYLGTRCSVIWADGTTSTNEVLYPVGEPSNPITEAKVVEKYVSLAVPVYGAAKAEGIKNFVLAIEEKNTLQELLELIE